ncbi:hypothetical protein RGU11_18005 [Rossellomorea marisflavi]|uniref:hypothetical protein n=1 Tax=Rossellomorea marisflavi TaxID=189381 RepID=UPI0028533B7B|nr:hypothetical protein [Rossellomorea marisflavi]MDR4938276.1 hypothetical protein [Rossellomorea marisflavi]
MFDRPYEPTSEEAIILGEMVQKTVESKEYKDLAKAEKVIAIETGIDKNKGGRFPYNMMTSVRTDKETHLFSCSDDKCTKMELIGTSYSIYQDEEPRLPLKK